MIIYRDDADATREFEERDGHVCGKDGKPIKQEGLYYRILPTVGKQVVIVGEDGRIIGEQG